MIFNSFQFLWMFPLIFLVYWGLSRLPWMGGRVRLRVVNVALTAISYGLYMQWKPAYALLLLGVTAVTCFGAIVVGRGGKSKSGQKCLIVAFAILALLPLFIFKYYNFIDESDDSMLSSVGVVAYQSGLKWVLPIGISLFSLDAVGYLFNVNYGRIGLWRFVRAKWAINK